MWDSLLNQRQAAAFVLLQLLFFSGNQWWKKPPPFLLGLQRQKGELKGHILAPNSCKCCTSDSLQPDSVTRFKRHRTSLYIGRKKKQSELHLEYSYLDLRRGRFNYLSLTCLSLLVCDFPHSYQHYRSYCENIHTHTCTELHTCTLLLHSL